jgi:hypothetical protein
LKANPQPRIEAPADTPRQRDFRPSDNHVGDSTDEDVTAFETPRVLKKIKKRVERASETEDMISDEEKNKVKSVEKTKGQNKGNNKRDNTAVSCCVVIF